MNMLPVQPLAKTHRSVAVFARIENDAYFTLDPRASEVLFIGLGDDAKRITGAADLMCGGGHLMELVKARNIATYASDLEDYGYYDQMAVADVFDAHYLPIGFNSSISNPVYKHPTTVKMIKHLIKIAPEGGLVCMLLPHAWDAAGGRAELFTSKFGYFRRIVSPVRYWWFHPEYRVVGKDGKLKQMTPRSNHSWHIWMKGFKGDATNCYFPASKLAPFDPNTDVMRQMQFCTRKAPLIRK